jgi:hypothetical protein
MKSHKKLYGKLKVQIALDTVWEQTELPQIRGSCTTKFPGFVWCKFVDFSRKYTSQLGSFPTIKQSANI